MKEDSGFPNAHHRDRESERGSFSLSLAAGGIREIEGIRPRPLSNSSSVHVGFLPPPLPPARSAVLNRAKCPNYISPRTALRLLLSRNTRGKSSRGEYTRHCSSLYIYVCIAESSDDDVASLYTSIELYIHVYTDEAKVPPCFSQSRRRGGGELARCIYSYTRIYVSDGNY